ncbi:hypothetical protein GCM10011490_24220 [Pseudoclavibacter endophyticus]|uniref:DUF3168 domain-containing protein n=1 Tax=Pseudoclavibacter endophyticus TaxID=1778590 RepID=A0A6H9WHA0_9MICO|nr:hypothetical protein [Pseudoclavibacter endophyticus]KAB1648424.1 hypothetical protein F8O04_12120 [Pseudoclavibacter endophyticus]GGA72598.1 hypothetical protein GCM10011490_24220 [Pseudoclavibacter endophyticus]
MSSFAEMQAFADLITDVDVYLFEAPGEATEYVLLLGGATFDVQERLTGSRGPRDVTVVAHAIAPRPREAQWVADQVDGAVRPAGVGVIPLVEGRECDPIQRDAALGPERDDTGAPYWDAIQEYSFRSRPA